MFRRLGATVRAVLVLLPPSETKRGGGEGPPLRLDLLAHPELNPLRAQLVDELVKLAAERRRPPGPRWGCPRSRTRRWRATRSCGRRRPCPRCTATPGCSTTRSTSARCGARPPCGRGARLVVGSALFGLLTADDPVPAYRLSAGSALPGRGTLAAAWRPGAGAGARGRRRAGAGGRPALRVVRGAGPGARRGDGDRPHGRRARSSATSTRRTRDGSRGCWSSSRAEPTDAAGGGGGGPAGGPARGPPRPTP